MKLNPLWRRTRVLAVVGVFGLSRVMHAQGTGSMLGMELETRASLEAEAARAETQHRTQEAWLLRTRLQKGDFQDGDRIVVKLLGSVTLPNDTVVVRAGKMLPLPSLPDMSLEGVLRSELEPRLSTHIGKYLRDSSVRAIPLLRLAVFGNVGKPGWFYVPADVLLNDAIMHAGGPGATADMNNMVIRRGGDVIWSQQDTRTALADGMSLDRLHLRAGDELYVDDVRGAATWVQYLQFAGPLVALLTLGIRYLR
jgi:hypothetical protein